MNIERIWEAKELKWFSKEVTEIIYKYVGNDDYILWGNGEYYAVFCPDIGESIDFFKGNIELLEHIKELIIDAIEYGDVEDENDAVELAIIEEAIKNSR